MVFRLDLEEDGWDTFREEEKEYEKKKTEKPDQLLLVRIYIQCHSFFYPDQISLASENFQYEPVLYFCVENNVNPDCSQHIWKKDKSVHDHFKAPNK